MSARRRIACASSPKQGKAIHGRLIRGGGFAACVLGLYVSFVLGSVGWRLVTTWWVFHWSSMSCDEIVLYVNGIRYDAHTLRSHYLPTYLVQLSSRNADLVGGAGKGHA